MKNLEKKAWWRLLKVIYLAVYICLGIFVAIVTWILIGTPNAEWFYFIFIVIGCLAVIEGLRYAFLYIIGVKNTFGVVGWIIKANQLAEAEDNARMAQEAKEVKLGLRKAPPPHFPPVDRLKKILFWTVVGFGIFIIGAVAIGYLVGQF